MSTLCWLSAYARLHGCVTHLAGNRFGSSNNFRYGLFGSNLLYTYAIWSNVSMCMCGCACIYVCVYMDRCVFVAVYVYMCGYKCEVSILISAIPVLVLLNLC
jgi:hypothetical protein